MKAESRIKSASRYCIFFDLIMKGMCLPSKPQNVILSLSPNENLIVLLKKKMMCLISVHCICSLLIINKSSYLKLTAPPELFRGSEDIFIQVVFNKRWLIMHLLF